MKIFNNGILEVLLHGKPTSDPEVEKKVWDALGEAGMDFDTGSARVQRRMNGIDVEFEGHLANELESDLNSALDALSPVGVSFDGTLDYYGDYDGYIVVGPDGAVSMDKEEYGLRSATTEALVDILERRGFGVVPCVSMAQARRHCSETREWLKRKQAKEALDMAAKPMKSVDEMSEEAANNKLEEEEKKTNG